MPGSLIASDSRPDQLTVFVDMLCPLCKQVECNSTGQGGESERDRQPHKQVADDVESAVFHRNFLWRVLPTG